MFEWLKRPALTLAERERWSQIEQRLQVTEEHLGDLLVRFNRTQSRELMRAARSKKDVGSDVLAEAENLLAKGAPSAATPTDGNSKKLDLWSRM